MSVSFDDLQEQLSVISRNITRIRDNRQANADWSSKETDILASCTMYSMMTTSPTTSYSRVTYKALDISYCVSHKPPSFPE
jgi:hypothetical protein